MRTLRYRKVAHLEIIIIRVPALNDLFWTRGEKIETAFDEKSVFISFLTTFSDKYALILRVIEDSIKY